MHIRARSLSRREAVQRMIAAAAAVSLLDRPGLGASSLAAGIGTDPNLHVKIIPWDRVLTAPEMETVTVLCDVIIPADDTSPAASAVGVPDFVNEWVSAPYPAHVRDLEEVRTGIQWMNEEAERRFGKPFPKLAGPELEAICDDVCFEPRAKPEHRKGAAFFGKMRNLAAGGYYTTPEGMKDIGYVGNTPMAEFPGPPPEVLAHLGLA